MEHDGVETQLKECMESGKSRALEDRLLSILQLKFAVGAGTCARISATIATSAVLPSAQPLKNGTTTDCSTTCANKDNGGQEKEKDPLVQRLGFYFEAIAVAYHLVEHVAVWRRLQSPTAAHTKLTLPIAMALGRLPPADRSRLLAAFRQSASPQSLHTVAQLLESSGALTACMEKAAGLVHSAWLELSSVLRDSYAKMHLRAFGLYVLDRYA